MKKNYDIIFLVIEMKELKLLGIILLSACLLVGCEKKRTIEVNGETINTKEMIHEYCERMGTLEGGTADLHYDIYYTGDRLNVLRSEETVRSTSSSVLDEYENSYKTLHNYYKDLKYYDTSIIRDDEHVSSIIIINYDKIDMDELISIEGLEDNIIEDGVPKVQKWKDLAKKIGATCERVEEEV